MHRTTMLWPFLFAVLQCPIGDVGSDERCFVCPAGFYSNDGLACYACAPGTFSLAGATRPMPCPPGTYNAYSASSSCKPCAICANRSKASLPCTATTDTYCSDCEPCPANTYMTGLLTDTPKCSPCTQCAIGTIVLEACDGVSNTVCSVNTGLIISAATVGVATISVCIWIAYLFMHMQHVLKTDQRKLPVKI